MADTRYSGNEYIHNLHMGDMFRFPGDPYTVYGPVAGTLSGYMLGWTVVRFAKDEPTVDRHAFTRVEITKRAPKCGCGRSFENCENECEWPEELEKLWAASF